MKRFNLKLLFILVILIEIIMTSQVKSNAINIKYSLGSNIVDDNYIMYTKEVEKGSTILANSTTNNNTSSTSGISIILFIIAVAVIIELVVIFIRARGLEENKRGKNKLYK